jgi:hypothetical protein
MLRVLSSESVTIWQLNEHNLAGDQGLRRLDKAGGEFRSPRLGMFREMYHRIEAAVAPQRKLVIGGPTEFRELRELRNIRLVRGAMSGSSPLKPLKLLVKQRKNPALSESQVRPDQSPGRQSLFYRAAGRWPAVTTRLLTSTSRTPNVCSCRCSDNPSAPHSRFAVK